MRKIVIIFVFLIIMAGGAAWYFLVMKNTSAFTNNSAFKAVPIHSPLVIEVQNFDELIRSFSGKNIIINELKSTGVLTQLANELQYINKLNKSNPEINKLSNEKSLLVSLNFEGKNEVDFLFLVSLKDKKEQNTILEIIRQLTNQSTLSKRNYDGAGIYRVFINNTAFSFAFTNGIFVASKEAILVEEAIRQSNVENLLDHPDFQKLYKTSNSNAFANIFINHKYIGQLLAKSLNGETRKKIGYLSRYAERTELDLSLKRDELFLSGFTFSDDSSENYINLFKSQAPGRTNIESALPANTSLFLVLNIEKPSRFFEDYQEYSKIHGSFYPRETYLMNISKETKTDFLKLIDEITAGETGIAFTSIVQNAPANNRFFLMEVKSQSIAREKFELLLNKYIEHKKVEAGSWQSVYRIDDKRSFTFYQFPYPEISEILFGKIFSGVKSNFFTFYENYLIFADSQTALQELTHNLVLNETLARDINYLKFKENTSTRSNLYFYINFSKAFHLSRQFLNDTRMEEWNDHEEVIRKFQAVSWQFSNTNELILNNIYLKFDPVIKEEPQTVWQTKLGSNVLTKPQLVINHNDPANREIIFQDQANQLYLINKEGATLWKVQLPGPIMSEIHQVDYYKNGKYQYLFNTKNHLHLLDRNGETVAGYPIALRSPASNGVAVFDYDSNKNYRFFIACENKKIYAYTREGKFVKGWNIFTSDNPVDKPIQHMRVQNKDYIVFFDRYKTYFLDRQGKTRLRTKASFEHSDNDLFLELSGNPAVLCTDKTGNVYKLFFDGSFEKLETGNYSASHYFVAADLNRNGLKDFIFADGNHLTAISETGKKLFNKKMNKPVSEKPEIYSFSANNKKAGIVSADENRVYLINSDGSVYDGFPLQGSSKFCIGIISTGNKFFNLFVGNEDHSLYNYIIEY